MTQIERFHQSYARTLLTECPAALKRKLRFGMKPTRAMDAGSLVDVLLLAGEDRVGVCREVTYKSGKRKGETVAPTDWGTGDAIAFKAECREQGLIPALPHELEHAREAADRVRGELLKRGVDLRECEVQPTIQWFGDDGTPCEGTPDIMFWDSGKITTIDLKVGDECSPEWIESAIFKQFWDVQGAAYGEAGRSGFEEYSSSHEHWIVRSGTGPDPLFSKVVLSPGFMSLGRQRLNEARRRWRACIESKDWPGYEDSVARPQEWMIRQWLEQGGTLDPDMVE